MSELTIIYYTSNREKEGFEKKIRERILANCGDTPIVSVSQKPIDFGKNLCVGDVGACDHNLFRQIYLACKAVKTPYVVSCEADCLYPPDYFEFQPGGAECYRFDNLFILNEWGKGDWGGFWPKSTAPFAQIAKRDWYINEIEKALKDRPVWSFDGDRFRVPIFKRDDGRVEVSIKNPIISLKTGDGLRRHTEASGEPVPSLPYWGEAEELRKEIFYD